MALYDEILREANRAGRAATQMGSEIASDPLAYAGTVVPPLDYRTAYNPAGGYAEAGRPATANIDASMAQAWADPRRLDPSVTDWSEQRGVMGGADPRTATTPFYEQRMPYFGDASVVAPPRMPTERELMVSTQEGVENSDRAFSRLHTLWAQGHPFFSLDPDDTRQGYDTEGVGELPEFTEIYLQVPDEAKIYAHANKHDPKVLAQFEEKYGFPLDVSVEIIR